MGPQKPAAGFRVWGFAQTLSSVRCDSDRCAKSSNEPGAHDGGDKEADAKQPYSLGLRLAFYLLSCFADLKWEGRRGRKGKNACVRDADRPRRESCCHAVT